MATEQPFEGYTDQLFIGTSDAWVMQKADTSGVNTYGSSVFGRRTAGGPFVAEGNAEIQNSLVLGNSTDGFARFVTSTALFIQAGSLNSGAATVRDVVFSNMYGGAGGTTVRPGADNSGAVGSGSFRWSVLYAATGTINTSDQREKEWRGGLNEAELRAAKRIAGELGFYRWLDAIAEKGDAARLHFGARAQQVWSIMADEGLVDPIVDGIPGNTPYAFLCFDQWDYAEAVLDESGNVIAPPREAGDRFGVRVDQLALFLIAGQEQRLAALEAAL